MVPRYRPRSSVIRPVIFIVLPFVNTYPAEGVKIKTSGGVLSLAENKWLLSSSLPDPLLEQEITEHTIASPDNIRIPFLNIV